MSVTSNPSSQASETKIGIWFIGARGSVATTATLGLLGMQQGIAPPTGLVSELDEIRVANLVPLKQIVTGGHDVVENSLTGRARALAASHVVPPELVEVLEEKLDQANAEVKLAPTQGTQRSILDQLQSDISDFKTKHQLDQVVVLEVAATEAPADANPALDSLEVLEAALDEGQSPLPQSSLYPYAAYQAGAAYASFTPSPGPTPKALQQLAENKRVPWAGRDGKTGETLLKSTLAPMFVNRALNVLSWSSFNLLGGGDGLTLSDEKAAVSKTTTKGAGLDSIMGRHISGPLRIDYVQDMGDWKTAWDHISFEGFLGTKMTMQFTWQGADSSLAAPLVLDLARLIARAQQVGHSGVQKELGFFFKDPLGSDEHALSEQWSDLVSWCSDLGQDH